MFAQFNWGEFGVMGAVIGAQLFIIIALIKWLQAAVQAKDNSLTELRGQLVDTAQKFNNTVVVVFERLIDTIEDWELFLQEERKAREECMKNMRDCMETMRNDMEKFAVMLERICKEWNIKINGG